MQALAEYKRERTSFSGSLPPKDWSAHKGLHDFKGISGLGSGWLSSEERQTLASPWCLLLWALSSNGNSLLRGSNHRQRRLVTVKTSRLMFSCKAPYTENSPFLLPSCHNPTIEVPGNLRKKNENRSSIDVIDVMLFFFHYCRPTCKAVRLSQS